MHSKVEAVLAPSGAEYKVHNHRDFPVAIRSPHDFAGALGYDVDRIAKTLLVRSTDGDTFAAIVLSCTKRVNLEKIAQTLGVKRVQMATRDELAKILDYPPTGVSPLGAAVPVLIDEGLKAFPTILVGAGKAAVEIEIAPESLVLLTDAKVLSFAE